jgi:hypothetical protein
VPMTVAGEPVKALGPLEWVPASSSGTSPLLFIGLGGLLIGAIAGAVALARRRRSDRPARGPKPVEEAW